MDEKAKPEVGSVGWCDLTVPDAPRVRDFYAQVVGWGVDEVDMGGYADYSMTVPGTGMPAAGVCHARGVNADLPQVWIVYITVADLSASLDACRRLGGEVVAGPKDLGASGSYAVVRDPAGAVCGLIQPG